MPQRASSTARIIASRALSQPTTARRGVAKAVGAISAWISTSTGRLPSMPANTAEPETSRSRSARNSADGFGHLAQPSVAHLEDADFVGRPEAVLHRAKDAELVAAFAFEIQHRIDHVFEHLRTRDHPFLGDVADQQEDEAVPLGEPDQHLRRGAHLRHRPRRRVRAHRRTGSAPSSTTTMSAPRGASSVAAMSPTEVAAASCTGASRNPSRSARSRSWSIASSPEM